MKTSRRCQTSSARKSFHTARRAAFLPTSLWLVSSLYGHFFLMSIIVSIVCSKLKHIPGEKLAFFATVCHSNKRMFPSAFPYKYML